MKKHVIKYPMAVTAATKSRKDIIRLLADIYDEFSDKDYYEYIMREHGANPDDSDPDEGYFNTMSLQDLEDAYDEAISVVASDIIGQLTDDLIEPLKETYTNIVNFMTYSRRTFESMPEHIRGQFHSILSGIDRLSDVIKGE